MMILPRLTTKHWLGVALLCVGIAASCGNDLIGPELNLDTGASAPGLVCIQQLTTTVTLKGTGLSPTVFDALEDERVVLPQIDLIRRVDLEGTAVDETPIRVPDDEADGRVRWIDAQTMEFDVYPELGLTAGVYDILLTNPDGTTATATEALGGLEAPTLTEVIPAHICLEQGAQSFELRGTGFVVIGGALPTVGVGPNNYEVDSVDDCVDLSVPVGGVQLCQSATVTLPEDDLEVGEHTIALTNPAPVECASTEELTLEITATPTITEVDPLTMCTGGGEFVVTGTGFTDRATVSVGGVPASSVDVVSSTELIVRFGLVELDAGSYDLLIEQDGCIDTFDTQVTIVDGIIVFFADPPVVFNGIDTQVTVFVSGLNVAPDAVRIIDPAGTVTDLSASIIFPRPGRVQVTLPSALAVGSYDILVEDGETTCEAVLADGITVTNQQVLAVESINPQFGHTAADTAIELRAEDPAPGGEVQFVSTPRAYLSPQGGGIAAQIGAVAFVSATRLTGIVPSGLPVGSYDVIVVNPGGEVGVLAGAFDVTAEAPPEVDSVTPGSLEASVTPQPATIEGRNFRTPAVELICRLADGSTIVNPTIAIVDNTGAESIDITVDTSVLDQGTICVVRVINTDGTFEDFSAITIANPAQAQNAITFSAGPGLITPRRAPAAASGRASRVARFIYAIGGDDGTEAGATTTVEASTVDLFGELSGWFELPISLPSARTLARAVTIADRFIYLVGGNDGTGPVASTLRAKILDPADRPEIDDLDLTLEDTGLDAGTYIYRLSALVAVSSVQEPGGGELLASDPFVVQLPSLGTKKVQLRLLWNPVADATGYRLYRTPVADQASGEELLLAEIAAGTTEFIDDGSVTPAGDAPLPLGSTGIWHEIDALTDARQGHGLTAAKDPVTDGLVHIYAVSGEDAGGELDTVEVISVTVNSTAEQTPTAWSGAVTLPTGTGRSGMEALTADSTTASNVGTDVFLYALAGSAGAGTDSTTNAVQVGANGVLDAGGWGTVDPMTPTRTNYVAAIANNFLFVLGGSGTETSGSKANICSGVSAGCATTPNPPELGGWTSLSAISMQPHALAGKAVQSSFIYVIGGVDGAGTVVGTTDQSVLGGQP